MSALSVRLDRPAAAGARRLIRCALVALAVSQLAGCAAAVIGAGATGVAVAHDRRTAGTMVEDQTLELKFGNLLSSQTELAERTHIEANSYNRVLLLTGQTPDVQSREAVVAIARKLENVRRIHNEISIAPPTSGGRRTNDNYLTAKVKSKMAVTAGIDPTRVKAVTENGVVYLMGLVEREEGQRAIDVARQTGGVSKVVVIFEYLD